MNYKITNKIFVHFIVCCLFLRCFTILYANDTKVTVASGGIVIENKEPDIEMASEKLEISIKKIKVTYDFFNHGPTKKITIGFPLPNSPYDMNDPYPYASWDEAQIALRTLYGDDYKASVSLAEQMKHAEIIDFTVFINDKMVEFERHFRAYCPNGKDITDTLRKHRIPISSAYLRGFVEPAPMDLLPGLKETLKELGLLDAKERPNWYLKTTYVWQQEFLANKATHVEHSYTPSYGLYWIDVEAFNDRKNVKNHRDNSINLDECTFDSQYLEEFIEQWRHDSKKKKSKCKQLYEVRYVLKTGANWRDPIGKFHLEIHPTHSNDLIILDGKYPMKRQRNGVYVINLENFKPTEDLRIWILPFNDLENSEQPTFSIQNVWKKIKNLWR
ncbi:MAG: DUF4424 family protein [Alphaproteobacteria bacterium]